MASKKKDKPSEVVYTLIVRLSQEQRTKLERLVGKRGPFATMSGVIRELIDAA